MGIRTFAVGGSLVILAMMAISVAIYFRVIPVPMSLLGAYIRPREPEFSARYYPPDTVAYAWATLLPRGKQSGHMQDIWDRLNEYPGFVRTLDDWKSGFTEETGISFDENVGPWIGPELSAGLLDADARAGIPAAVILIGVRDEDEAETFVELWTAYASREWNTAFATGELMGNTTWISSDAGQAYSLTNGWLVVATDEATLHDMIVRIEGGGEGSLAETVNFQQARLALAEDRFGSVYLRPDAAGDLVAQLTGELAPAVPGYLSPMIGWQQNPAWAGLAGTWVDSGLLVNWVSPPASTTGLKEFGTGTPARLLPEDTLAFVAASFDPNLDHWREVLGSQRMSDALPGDKPGEGFPGLPPGGMDGEEYVPGQDRSLAAVLDLGLEAFQAETGIDPEADFLDHLDGTVILAVHDFDLEAVRREPAANPIGAAVMLSYKQQSREQLDATMSELADLASRQAGLDTGQVDIGGEGPAVVFDLAALQPLTGGPTEYRPGYVLHDQYLTLGTTESALITVVGLQNGQGSSLTSNDEYLRAVQYLPAAQQVAAYVAIHPILSQLGETDVPLEKDQLDALRGAVGSVAFGYSRDEDYSRGVAVITLFPE